MIPGELDVADFNFGAFLDFKDEDDGVAGGDALVLRLGRWLGLRLLRIGLLSLGL